MLLSEQCYKKIDRELAKYPADQRQSAVMASLAHAQVELGWLSPDTMQEVADYIGMPAIAVQEVATFYNMYNTRPVGKHAIKFDHKHPSLAKLPAGSYTLVVEAAREVGGRELVRIPFKWRGVSSANAQGKTELGRVSIATTR